jgi:ABC-2 type transport system permease protein
MTLLSVERIKLFSTRSPYWCLASILAAALLFGLLMGLVDNGQQATIYTSQVGLQLGMMIFMVLAALAMTTEYRFGTIRASFLSTPHRGSVLLAKTVLLAVLAAVTAAVCAFAAFFLTKALATSPERPLDLTTGTDWRVLLGTVALYPIAAVIAVSVGTLIRHSAGAITLLLVWAMMIEGLVSLIPSVGPKISPWLPFNAGAEFVSGDLPGGGGGGPFGAPGGSTGPTPVEGLLVFIGTAVVLWLIALVVLRRRDA